MSKAASSPRVDWVDIAKGIAIILVVLNHSTLILSQNDLADPLWAKINSNFRSFRMPLFFFASGVFAASAMRRPWKQFWNSKLAIFCWTYAIWIIIRFGYFLVVPMEARPQENNVEKLLLAPVWPTTGLWFLFALFGFFLITKFLNPFLRPGIQLVIGAALSILSFAPAVITVGNLAYDGMLRYYLYFLIGVHLRKLFFNLAVKPRPIMTILSIGAFWGFLILIRGTDLGNLPGSRTALSLIAIVAGVLLAKLFSCTPLHRPLAYLGKNTLPIYVAHVILIAAMTSAMLVMVPAPSRALTIILPAVFVVLGLVIPLIIVRLVSRSPLRYLYEVPPWLQFQNGANKGSTHAIPEGGWPTPRP